MSPQSETRTFSESPKPGHSSLIEKMEITNKSSLDKEEEWDWSHVRLNAEGTLLKSTYPGIHKISDQRGQDIINYCAFDWLKKKREDDGIEPHLWRVHDKLYNLEGFIDNHPGGKDWLELTRGTDITEAFETSHVANVNKVEVILSKYFVKKASTPRNSPYSFKEHGFYKVLKRRVAPIFQEIGTDPTAEALLIQDTLAITYILLSGYGVWLNSVIVILLAGLALGAMAVGAHNFFHMKDNWRMYYFDLTPLSSREWRVSHALSHHLFPNTILDFEIASFEPLLEWLPCRPKSWAQRFCSPLYSHLIYAIMMPSDFLRRLNSLRSGKSELRPENGLVVVQLLLYVLISQSVLTGLKCWILIFLTASWYFCYVGLAAGHHHPMSFHDGDEPRQKNDFGLCQLDSVQWRETEEEPRLVHTLVTFGEHPIHHLFPTVCHSKLPAVRHVVLKTLSDFNVQVGQVSTVDAFLGLHDQLARVKPVSLEDKRKIISSSSS